MSLPVVRGSWREKELKGCPLLIVAGGEFVYLPRVCEAFGLSRLEACRIMGQAKLQPETLENE